MDWRLETSGSDHSSDKDDGNPLGAGKTKKIELTWDLLQNLTVDFKETGQATETRAFNLDTASRRDKDWDFTVKGKPFREDWSLCGNDGDSETCEWVYNNDISITNGTTDYRMMIKQGDNESEVLAKKSTKALGNKKVDITAYSTKNDSSIVGASPEAGFSMDTTIVITDGKMQSYSESSD